VSHITLMSMSFIAS